MSDYRLSNCPGREEQIYLYLDDELTASQRDEFMTHLDGCPTCRQLMIDAETLFERLSSLAAVDLPAVVVAQGADDIMTRLSEVAQLPKATSAESKGVVGQAILGVQLLVGLVLVFMTLPSLMAQYQSYWPQETTFRPTVLLDSLIIARQGWADTLADWDISQVFQLASTSLLDIPAEWTLGLALILGIGWLLGNTLLLGSKSQTFRNGGAA